MGRGGQTRTLRRPSRQRPPAVARHGGPPRSDQSIRWLGTAWALIGVGAAVTFGAFSWAALFLVAVGSVVLVSVLLTPSRPSMHHWVFACVIGTTGLLTPFYPWRGAGPDLLSVAIVTFTLLALAIMVTGVVSSPTFEHRPWRFAAMTGLASAAAVATIFAAPTPRIDVWFMYQAASTAVGHGHNFYLTHWTSGLVGEVSNQFTYLPLSALLLAPFHALFGDVRYGLWAATVFAAWCAYRLAGPRSGWLCGGLILLSPKVAFGLAMSWNDPLLLAGIGGMVLAVRRHRPGWATVALVVVLSSKQYGWLFLPLAAAWKDFGWRRALAAAAAALAVCLPWLLGAPRAFWQGAIAYNLYLRPRLDSLSLYSALLHRGVVPGYFLIAGLTLVGLAAALLRLPRDAFGFLGGCTLVMATFNLANKQSFFNQWELVGGLIALCMAVALGTADMSTPPRVERTPDTETIGAHVPTV